MPRRPDQAARPSRDPAPDTQPEEGGPAPDPLADDDEGPDTPHFPVEDEQIVELTEEDDYLRALWYGPQGSGKTTHTARVLLAEPQGRLLVCNAEAGAKIRALRRHGIPVERVAVWPKPGVRPTFDGLERLVMQVDAALAAARKNGEPKPYCAFDLDSVTELVKLMLDNIQEDGIAGQRELDRKARAAGVNPPRRNQRKRFQLERDDYGLVSQQMRNILRRLRYMDLHFLATALVRRDEDQDTGVVMYGPAMPPALQSDLLGYMDVVIRTEVRADGGKEEFVGYTRPDESHHGKDRYGLLPRELLDPAADVVLGHIRGDAPAPEVELTPVIDSTNGAPAMASDEAVATVREEIEADVAAAVAETAKKTPRPRTRARKQEPAKVGATDGSDDEPPF